MYFGDRNNFISRKPDPEKELLAEQNALLKKLLVQQDKAAKKPRAQIRWNGPHHLPRTAMLTVAILILACGFFAYHALTAPKKHHIADTSAFPASTIQQIRGFKFYYLKPGFQTDFTLQRNTVTVTNSVLVFEMKSPTGKMLAFTEEATPPGYGVSALQTTTKFDTQYGKAFITDEPDRTTGGIFTKDNTWVLINAPKPIGVQQMQHILDALTPTSPNS